MFKNKLPVFNSEEEEAHFWDTHDSREYLGEFKSADIEVTPELEELILTKRKLDKTGNIKIGSKPN